MTVIDNQAEKDGLDMNVEEQELGTRVHAANADIEHNDAESKAFDRKLILKLDLLLIPLLTMVYLLAFLDRANIGNARIVSTLLCISLQILLLTG